MLSPEAEIESLRSTVARFFSVYGVVVSPMALTFQVGAPPGGIDAPFDALRIELVPKDYIPTVTQEKGETLVHVQRRPRPRFARTQVNLILLLVTVSRPRSSAGPGTGPIIRASRSCPPSRSA